MRFASTFRVVRRQATVALALGTLLIGIAPAGAEAATGDPIEPRVAGDAVTPHVAKPASGAGPAGSSVSGSGSETAPRHAPVPSSESESSTGLVSPRAAEPGPDSADAAEPRAGAAGSSSDDQGATSETADRDPARRTADRLAELIADRWAWFAQPKPELQLVAHLVNMEQILSSIEHGYELAGQVAVRRYTGYSEVSDVASDPSDPCLGSASYFASLAQVEEGTNGTGPC